MQQKKSTNVNFSDRLRTVANEKGVDQSSLARKTGITHAAINNYWNKGRTPKAEELHKIAIALGTTMEWLLTGDDVDLGNATDEWKTRALHAEQRLNTVKSTLITILKKF